MSSVVVKSVDFDLVRRAMDAWAAHLLATRPDVEEIVVFGSFAEGRYAPGSDLDVLVVLARAEQPVRDRIGDLLPDAFPVGVDLFPFTRDELRERSGSPVLEAIRRSRWRYLRGAGVPALGATRP